MPAEENEISKFCFFGKGYRAPPLNGRETRVVYDENFVKSFYRFPFPREIVAVKFTDNGVFEASPVIALPRKDRSSVLLINLKKEDENEETKEGTLENVQEALNKLSLIKNDSIEANQEVDNNKDEDIKQIVLYDKNKIKDETQNITENGSADSNETSMIVKHQSAEDNEIIPVKECNNDGKHDVSDKINIIKNAEKALRNWAKSLSDDLASNNQKSEVKSNEIYSSNCKKKSSFLKQNGTSRRKQEGQVEESSLLLKVSKSCKSLKIDEKEEKFGSEIQMTRKTFIQNKRTNVESVGVEKSLNENGNACSSNCSNCGKVSESIVSSSCVQERIKQPKKCICQCSSECLSDFQTARKRIKMCSVLDNTNNKSSSPHRSSVATHTQGTHSLYSSHSSRVHVPEKKMHVSLKQSSAKRINSVVTTVVSRNSLDRLNTIRKDSRLIARKKMRRLIKKSRGQSLVHMMTGQLNNDRRRTIKTTRNSTENYLWTSESKGTRKLPQLKTSLSSTTDTAFDSKSLLLNSEIISSSEKGVCTSESELCKKNNEMPNRSLGLSLLQSDVDEPFHGFASDIQNSVMEDRNNIVQKEKELITQKFNEANRSSLESLSSIQNSEPKMSDRQNVEDCCGRSAKMNYKNINKIVKEIIDDESLWAANDHFSKSSNHIDSSTSLLERLKKNTISNNDLLGISETGSERNTDKSLSESNYSSDGTHMSTAQKNKAIASKVGSSRHTVCKSTPHRIGFQDKMLPKRMAQDQDSVKTLSSIAAYPKLRACLLANVRDSKVPPVKRTQESPLRPMSKSQNRPSLGIATSDVSNVANGLQNCFSANVSDSKVPPVKRIQESFWRPISRSHNMPSLGIATSDVANGPQNCLSANVSDSKVPPVERIQESFWRPTSKSQSRPSLGNAASDVTSVATRSKNISSANTESCLNKHSITEKDSPAVYASNGKLHARSITVKRPLLGKAPFAKADSTIRGEIWCVEGVAVPHITNKLQRDSTDTIISRGKELSKNGTSKKVLGVIAQSINIPSEDSTEFVDSSQRMPTEMSCSQETTFSNYLEGIEQNTTLGLSKTTQGTTSKIIEPNSKPNLSKRTRDSCPKGGKKTQNNQSKIIEPCSKGTKRTEDHSSKRFKPETSMNLSKRTVDTSSENVKHNSKTLESKRTQVTPSKKIKTSTRSHETKEIQIASSHVAKKVNESKEFFKPNPVVFEGFEPNSRTRVAVKTNAISFKGFEPKSRTTVTVETKATSFKGFEPNSRMHVTVKGSTPNSKVHTKVKIRNTEMQKSEGFDSKQKGDSDPSEDTDLNISAVVSYSHKSKRTKCDHSKSEIKKVPGRVKKHLTSSCSRSIISNKKKSKKQSVINSSTKQEMSGECSELYSKQSAIGEGEQDSRSVLMDASNSSEVGGTEDLKVLKNWSETVTKLAELEVPLTDFESFIAVNNFNIEEQEGSDLGEEENRTESPVKAVSRCHKRRRRWACGNLLKRKNRSRQSTIRKAKQNSDAEFTDAPRCLKEEQEDDVKSDKDFKLQLEEEHEDCFGYAKFPCPIKVEDTESEPLNADAPFPIKMEVTKTEPLNADDYLFLRQNVKCEPSSSHGCSTSETHVDGRFLPFYSAKTEPNEIHQTSFQRTSPVCKEEPELVFEIEQFSCYYCGFRTKKKILLKQHMRLSHSHDRFLRAPKDAVYHWCHVCPYVTEDLVHYVRHISGKHGQLFECQYCDFDTPDEETFTEHVRVDHTELVICPHCDHESVGRLALRTHIHCSHHNLELERCRACFRGFCSSEELKKHKKKHHPKLPRIRRRRHRGREKRRKTQNFGCTTKI